MNVTGKTKQLAILGNPVEHSFSPQMHNYISEKMGLDYIYTALHVDRDNFKEAVDGIRHMNFSGVNITSPFKFQAMELMDFLSDKAKKFGSVNTCVCRNGKLYGYNTDADGFYRSILRAGGAVKDKDVLFVGAGGATQPAAVLFADAGAKSIAIINRTQEKAEAIADYVKNVSNYNVEVGIKKEHYDLVINTTTVGMSPDIDRSPLSDMPFVDENTFAADMIYNPEKTLFLKQAEEKGAKTCNGLGMLIYQGIIAYELFTGITLPDSIFDEILHDVFHRQ